MSLDLDLSELDEHLDERYQCILCGSPRQLDSSLCLECEDKMNAQEKDRLMYECE